LGEAKDLRLLFSVSATIKVGGPSSPYAVQGGMNKSGVPASLLLARWGGEANLGPLCL